MSMILDEFPGADKKLNTVVHVLTMESNSTGEALVLVALAMGFLLDTAVSDAARQDTTEHLVKLVRSLASRKRTK